MQPSAKHTVRPALSLLSTAMLLASSCCQAEPAAAGMAPLAADQTRRLKPRDGFRECAHCPEMVVVPPGRFTMGSPDSEKGRTEHEGPQHEVTIAKPFAVGKYPVTYGEFAAFVKEAGEPPGQATCQSFLQFLPDPPPAVPNGPSEYSWHAMGYKQTDRSPAACISWTDAAAYAAWLAKKTGRPYRLLSEAEWEYAARARTSPGPYAPFSFGKNADEFCRYGNGADAALKAEILRQKLPADAGPAPYLNCHDGYPFTSPVGSFQPNAFGLYDMQGNVTQWLADCAHENYDGAPLDGSAWISKECNQRTLRGSSWAGAAESLRVAARGYVPVTENGPEFGFRVARTLD